MSGALGGAGLQLFEPRNAAAALVALLAIYTAGFLCFRPAAITIADEGTYVRQAQLIAAGTTGVEIVDPFTGAPTELRPINRYPLGTALLLLPFVSLGGREAASLLSLLCTVAGVALTARWLHEQGRSPLFAVLALAYPATIVMGRVAMSEAPSLACVSLGLWLYGRGLGRGGWPWLGAGFAAGFSFALRESNVLLFAPLFAGSLLRRDPGVPALVVGGLLGTSVRFLASWLFFGDPFFVKPPDAFSPGAILSNAPTYLFCLLVLVPGGLVAAFAYRGPRRPEIVATVVLFVLFYLSYTYSAGPSGWAKRLVLGPRYFIPLLPVLSLCAAEVWPRLAARFRARAGAYSLM